ncbi:hypothetical protein [Guptibacillus spartinae]|uniref:hypothetical protein n=1 Tax=Guptibacillus spartinae TaxID=3025679 RepID=UPI00235FDABA|nr:hypothetical protein [Pseudalkalibacillus spartinae]
MSDFISGNFGTILLFVLGFIIFTFLLKVAFRVALVLGLIAIILIFVFDFSPKEVFTMGKDVGEYTLNEANELYTKSIEPILEKEIQSATYTVNEQGDYTITSTNLKIVGKQQEDVATVIYKEKEYEISVQLLNTFLEENNSIPAV